jgi:cell division protein FtsA
MDLGVTLVDMGGGTTSIAVFYDGSLVHIDCLPVGGVHVTNDIARGLSTPLTHAERMKTLYGSTIPTPSDEGQIIDVPLIGESSGDNANHIPRSLLIGIIRPRVEEILELVRNRLEAAGVNKLAGRRMVLTGGASQLQGMRELAARVLDKQVRVGRPIRTAGLAEATAGPAFSTCAGLLAYAVRNRDAAETRTSESSGEAGRGLARLGRWFMANF